MKPKNLTSPLLLVFAIFTFLGSGLRVGNKFKLVSSFVNPTGDMDSEIEKRLTYASDKNPKNKEERSLIKDFLRERRTQENLALDRKYSSSPPSSTGLLRKESIDTSNSGPEEGKPNIDEKAKVNLEKIDANIATTIKALFESSVLVLENHMYYLMEKSEKTDYLNKLMESIEKVKSFLQRMRTMQHIISNDFNSSLTSEKKLEEGYNRVLERYGVESNEQDVIQDLQELFLPKKFLRELVRSDEKANDLKTDFDDSKPVTNPASQDSAKNTAEEKTRTSVDNKQADEEKFQQKYSQLLKETPPNSLEETMNLWTDNNETQGHRKKNEESIESLISGLSFDNESRDSSHQNNNLRDSNDKNNENFRLIDNEKLSQSEKEAIQELEVEKRAVRGLFGTDEDFSTTSAMSSEIHSAKRPLGGVSKDLNFLELTGAIDKQQSKNEEGNGNSIMKVMDSYRREISLLAQETNLEKELLPPDELTMENFLASYKI